jgi:hypothetical protein
MLNEKKELIKINRTKLFPKVILVLAMSLFLVSIIAVATPVKAAEPSRILMIDIMAKGDDADIPGATTSNIGRIEFDKVSGVPLGYVEGHLKLYDETGEKFYSMKIKLKDAVVMKIPAWYCEVRQVWWLNLWLIIGEGKLRTTDIHIENFEYRGEIITLPNTGGKYVNAPINMMVSPNGDYTFEFPNGAIDGSAGGWAWAGIMGFDGIEMFGGVTFLTKYMEKWIP